MFPTTIELLQFRSIAIAMATAIDIRISTGAPSPGACEFTGEIDKAQGWQNDKPWYSTLSHTFIIISVLSFM